MKAFKAVQLSIDREHSRYGYGDYQVTAQSSYNAFVTKFWLSKRKFSTRAEACEYQNVLSKKYWNGEFWMLPDGGDE